MNIFAIDEDPKISAQQLVDCHVIKMLLESAQMISTVANARGYVGPYKSTHKNHPCTVWAGSDPSNMRWLFDHAFELCNEYTSRYGKVHASQAKIQVLWNDLKSWWPEVENSKWQDHTTFAQAMPEHFRSSYPVEAYRSYYKVAKGHLASWKNPDRKPTWY